MSSYNLVLRVLRRLLAQNGLCESSKLSKNDFGKRQNEWGAHSHAADDKPTEDWARKRELPQSPCPATGDDSQEQLESVACIANGMSGVVCPESHVPCDGDKHPQLHIDELALIGLGSHCDRTWGYQSGKGRALEIGAG